LSDEGEGVAEWVDGLPDTPGMMEAGQAALERLESHL